MDPNAALANLRDYASQVLEDVESSDLDAETLASQFVALDEWLGRGGFPPAAWDKRTIIWTLTPDELDALREDLQGARTLRVSVDWGDLKWKVNEDMWSPGREPDDTDVTEAEPPTEPRPKE